MQFVKLFLFFLIDIYTRCSTRYFYQVLGFKNVDKHMNVKTGKKYTHTKQHTMKQISYQSPHQNSEWN